MQIDNEIHLFKIVAEPAVNREIMATTHIIYLPMFILWCPFE